MVLNEKRHGLFGVGSSAAMAAEQHKIIIEKLFLGLCEDLDNDMIIHQEWCIDRSDLNSPAPDIVVFYKSKNIASVIIEVCRKNQVKETIAKIHELVKLYEIKEAFVYDYESIEWFCVGSDLDDDKSSESLYLSLNFDNYL